MLPCFEKVDDLITPPDNYSQWRPALFRRLGEVATAYERDPVQHFWYLGTWCFAAATWLHERHRLSAPHLDVRSKVDSPSLSTLLSWLKQIPPTTNQEELSTRLLQVLEALEVWVAQQVNARGAIRLVLDKATTRLSALEGIEDDFFNGVFRHWIHPESALRTMRDELQELSVGVTPMRYPPGPQAYLRRLAFYWQGRGMSVEPSQAATNSSRPHFRLDADVANLLERGDFRIVFCPLQPTFHPLFTADPAKKTFAVQHEQPMKAPELLRAHLERIVALAHKRQTHILLMPELTIDLEHRAWLHTALSQPNLQVARHADTRRANILTGQLNVKNSRALMAHVPGSFHVPQAAGRPVNEAILFDDLGSQLLTHHKRGYYRLQRKQVDQRFFPGLPLEGLPPNVQELHEGIECDSTLQVLDVSLGRIVVLICADGLDVGQPLREQLRQLQPDLVCVVAMSPKCNGFWTFAGELEQQGIGTLFVNAACVVEKADAERPMNPVRPIPDVEEHLLAFARLPWVFPDAVHAPPTHIRWRAATGHVEFFDHQKGKWQYRTPLTTVKTKPQPPLPFSLWPDGLALEINLGAFWEAYQRSLQRHQVV